MNEKTDDNVIFIGGKPFMNYVHGVSTQLTQGAQEITIKSRGKFISKAVDVAEVARKNNPLSVKEIKIASEEFENKEGKKVNVSIMEIILEKK